MARKSRKLTSTELQVVKEMAVTVTGYDSNSPIFGKRMPEVIAMIRAAITASDWNQADGLLLQLERRLAKNAIYAQARR